jgi:hypothetical protein
MKIDVERFRTFYADLRIKEAEHQKYKNFQLDQMAKSVVLEAIDMSIADAVSLVPLVMHLKAHLSASGFDFSLQEAKDLAESMRRGT